MQWVPNRVSAVGQWWSALAVHSYKWAHLGMLLAFCWNHPACLMAASVSTNGLMSVQTEHKDGSLTPWCLPLVRMYKYSLSVWYSLLKPLHTVYTVCQSTCGFPSYSEGITHACIDTHAHTNARTHARTHTHTHTHAHTHEDQRLSIAYMCINHM